MNGINKYLAATFLSATMLFTTGAQAMEIQQYDKMATSDQAAYDRVLWEGAEKVLKDEGRPDLAAQVERLFATTLPGDRDPIGVVEFTRNLAIVRADDAKNAVEHPNDPRSEVENAMAITLENNHIPLPDSFFTVGANSHPKLPPKDAKKKDDKKKN